MSVLRQQFLRRLVVDIAATPAVTLVDVFGPETPLEPPYAENTDHVIRGRQVRQNEAGFVVIELPATMLVADLTYDVEIWSRAASAAQKGLEAPLFPTGAAPAADPVLKRVVATGVIGNELSLPEILGGGFTTAALNEKDVPLLHVRADEFVRLRVANAAGALAAQQVVAKFDLGLNPADTNKLGN